MTEPPRADSQPLSPGVRFEIQGVYTIVGLGTVLTGVLTAGTIAPGVRLRLWKSVTGGFHPSTVDVARVFRHHHQRVVALGSRADLLARAEPGPDALGLEVKGLEKGSAAKGDLLVQ